MERSVAWLAGRGLARSCGFAWEAPERFYDALCRGALSRDAFESCVRAELAATEEKCLAQGRINTRPIERLLEGLERRSRPGWSHVFLTTNWNTILERALQPRGWSVWHLNGSLEKPGGGLATEVDTENPRLGTRHEGYRRLLEAEVRVLFGLSFASALDRHLIERLEGGGRTWVVVNEDETDLRRAARLLTRLNPQTVLCAANRFEDWVEHARVAGDRRPGVALANPR